MDQHYSTHRCLLGLVFVALSILVLSAPAAEDDATLLQQQAITRIDAVVDHFLKTGDFWSRIADLQQAESELTTSNQAFAARGDWSALAQGLFRLGQIQQKQAKWKPALTYYREAEATARRANDAAIQVKALTGVAKAEAALRDYGSAAVHAAQAVKSSEPLADQKLLFDALSVVSEIQIGQGNLNAAADTLNRAFTVAQKLDEISLFYSHLDRADVYFKFASECDFKQSQDACLEAIERARTDFDTALGLARKLGYNGLVQLTETLRANLKVREQAVLAQRDFNQSIRQFSVFTLGKATDVLVTEEFVVSGALPPAFETFFREFDKSRLFSSGFGSPLPLLHLDGLRRQSRDDHDGALQSFLRAVDLLEQDRGKLRDERDRGTFMEDKINVYYYAILQLLQHRRYAEAFELLERSRSRAMADLLASRPPGFVRPQERSLYGEAVKLKSEIAALQSELPAIIGQTDPQAQQSVAKLSTRIGQLENQYQTVIARMAKDAPRLNELLVSEPVSLAKLQQSMRKENYEVLQYLVLQHGVILWHISADAVHVLNVFLPRPQLTEKVAQLRKNLEFRKTPSEPYPTFVERTAQELFLFLVQPVKPWLKSDRLVIIPHGDLHQAPFQVLQDPVDGRFLGERYALSYAPSATVLLGLKKAVGVAGGKLLAIAAPDLKDEVEAIAKLYPGRAKIVVKEPLAKETEVKAWVKDYDIVHLSVHGKFETEPLLSYLELGGGGQDDGQLTAAEMFGLPLDQARLVVLSACETGKAEVTGGNEVLGMMRALIYAGAGSLILSYWQVDSDATTLWMESFYRAAQSAPPAEAARQALQAVKSRPEYQHPYFWAAFMTVGR